MNHIEILRKLEKKICKNFTYIKKKKSFITITLF